MTLYAAITGANQGTISLTDPAYGNWTLEPDDTSVLLPLWAAQEPGFDRLWAAGDVAVSQSSNMSSPISHSSGIPSAELPGYLQPSPANTVKANVTGSTATVTDVALAANTFLARSSSGNAAAKAITDAGLALVAAADAAAQTALLNAATTSLKGTVKEAAHQANSTAPDVATLVTDFNALLSKLQTAGLMA